MRKKIAIIGSGFSGISAASYLAAGGHDVHVFEKNASLGGRARAFSTDSGFVFDMGPSWYWMPDVFERFFADFGYKPSDFYELKLLEPAFNIVYENAIKMSVPNNYADLRTLFEAHEPGSAVRLDAFMVEAEYKYKAGMEHLVYMPGLSLLEFADLELIKGAFRLQVFSSFSKHVKKYFKHPHLVALMEFPVLFLGATPQNTPALYSLMNYGGLKLGTWYPIGGFSKVIDGMVAVAQKQGAQFYTNTEVNKIEVVNGQATGLKIGNETIAFDAIIASSDYQHTEEKLLEPTYRNYSQSYWEKKVFAPSSLIYYLGIGKKIEGLNHHTLFFDEDITQHAEEIYTEPQWPSKPLFYVCCPSKTDPTVAPTGSENLFLLMPIATDLPDNEEMREKYFDVMMNRLEGQVKIDIRSHIVYKQSYCVSDFKADYHSYKGNAYGLANTLMQTANLKPKIKNKKISNLLYTGQLTVPGPGVPPSIISGKVAAGQLMKQLKHNA